MLVCFTFYGSSLDMFGYLLCCLHHMGFMMGPSKEKCKVKSKPMGLQSESRESTCYPLVNIHILPWKDPPFFMGKSTISMAIFNSFLYFHQRVPHVAKCWSSTVAQLCNGPRSFKLRRSLHVAPAWATWLEMVSGHSGILQLRLNQLSMRIWLIIFNGYMYTIYIYDTVSVYIYI